MPNADPSCGIHAETSGKTNELPAPVIETPRLLVDDASARPATAEIAITPTSATSASALFISDLLPSWQVRVLPRAASPRLRVVWAACWLPSGDVLVNAAPAQWDASVNSLNSPVTRNEVCSPMSTALSPMRSKQRETSTMRMPHSRL